MSIAHLIAQQAQRTPEAAAIVGHGQAVTYGQLAMQVQAAATVLMKHGVKPGDGVALLLPHSPYWHWAFTLGALSLGACPLAAHPRVGGDFAGASLCRHLVAAPGDSQTTAAGLNRIELNEDTLRTLMSTRLVIGLPSLAQAEAQGAVLLLAHASHNGLRVVRLGTALLGRRVDLISTRHGYTPHSRTLCALAFDDGVGMQHAFATWMAGGSLVLSKGGDDVAEAVRRHLPDRVVTTPLGIGQLLKAFPDPAPGQAQRVLLVTDGMLPPEWAEKALQRLCGELRVVYANAEASEISMGSETGLAHHPGAMGLPFPEMEVEVVDSTGQPCPPLSTGILRVRSALAVTQHAADFAREGALPAFHDGWVYCEHAAWLTAEGRLAITGPGSPMAVAALVAALPAEHRPEEQGVSLLELEAAVSALPAVSAACVLVLNSADGPPMPVIAVVCATDTDLNALGRHIQVVRPGVPRFHLVQVPSMPRTELGGIDRERLARVVARGLTGPLTTRVPESAV